MIPIPVSIADLRCFECGATDIVSIAPGHESVISESTDIVVDRGQPVRATCLSCWLPAQGYQQTLFPVPAP